MKGLEALEKLTNYGCSKMSEKVECKEIIEKELKALEIAKRKKVNVNMICLCQNTETYNDMREDSATFLTKAEFKLLKEILK